MKFFLALVIFFSALPSAAQDWGSIGAFLQSSLAPGQELGGSVYWLPDSPDPAAATEAVGVVYPVVVGAAGNVSISVGHFTRHTEGWILAGTVRDLFGHEPRAPAFFADRIELTTTTLRDGEPRCCPTGETRWRVDRGTLAARPAQ